MRQVVSMETLTGLKVHLESGASSGIARTWLRLERQVTGGIGGPVVCPKTR